MPAGASRPNDRLPGSFSRLGRLPQCEVAGAVLIIFVHVNAGAGTHFAEILLREFSVAWKAGDAEVIRPIVGAVSHILLHQFGDEIRHLWNMFGGPHQMWLLDADHGRIFEKRLLIFRSVLLHADTIARRVADNLVVQ